MTTLVTGSRGKVGAALINLLHSQGAPVRAASAAPEKLELPAGVDSVKLDLSDPATFPAALAGATSVFLYAEPSHIDDFLQQAAAAGVQHIVLLSSSAVLAPDAAENLIAANHFAVEQALDASPITSTVLRPGAFAGNALQWAWALKSGGPLSLPYPGSYGDPLHELDLAETARAALDDPALQGGTYHLTGPEALTFTEQLAILETATGRTFPITRVTPDAWKEAMADYMPAAFADALLSYWASTDGTPAPLTHRVEALTGHPARTFTEWAKENADAFRS
jgi:uncharacterized protein YbjT (DUF2867 family)